MADKRPKVSIGLPVYNGENYLAAAIESILAQTYADYELIISDNASTDGTWAICQAYAAQDARIRCFRNAHNIGAAGNFNYVFDMVGGEYFKWMAHDDVIAPDFLRKCVAVLDGHPDVVLCTSKVVFIDADGAIKLHHVSILKHGNAPQAPVRFHDLILSHHWCLEVFGLIRTTVLRQTPLIASHVGSDRNLLAELGLYGRLYQIPEYLFHSRDHSDRSVQALPYRDRAAWFDASKAGKIVFPKWSELNAYISAIGRSPLSKRDKLRCFGSLILWLPDHAKTLINDPIVGARQLIARFIKASTKETIAQKVI